MEHPVAKLLAWYRIHSRRLPWRETTDPYHIWVSETMLQQTRVETVIPYYHAFLARFPTVRHLAAADPAEVLQQWQGLGYYTRARNLHRAAQALVQRWGGVFPPGADEFRRLPGVGPYTAGAVYSIAFDQPVPAVDGNVLRVMARWLGIADPVDRPRVRRDIEAVVSDWQSRGSPGAVTQALMEVGALICTPRAWRCGECPLTEGCAARREGRQAELPVRRRKTDRPVTDVIALWLHWQGRVLLVQRPAEGLLAGMWQLPAAERPRTEEVAPCDDDLLRWADEAFGRWTSGGFDIIQRARHEFTHRVWEVAVVRPAGWAMDRVQEGAAAWPAAVWAAPEEWRQYPLPRVYQRLLDALWRV